MFRFAGFLVLLVAVLFTSQILFSALPAKASSAFDTVNSALTSTGSYAGLADTPQSSNGLVAGIVNVALSLVGLASIALLIYAGYLYLMDQGGGEGVKKAKKLIASSIIGLILVITAYAISTYIMQVLTVLDSGTRTDRTPTTTGTGGYGDVTGPTSDSDLPPGAPTESF